MHPHKASSLTSRISAVQFNFSKAIVISVGDLPQDLEMDLSTLYCSLLKYKGRPSSLLSQDITLLCTRAHAAKVLVGRNFWLKNCMVDSLTKANLFTDRFLGHLLFGDFMLEKVIVTMKDKRGYDLEQYISLKVMI
uniref:Uncharacterized protein n=1 Tax=Sphaerodactylus townsendi TaxID=933632 RepID=A0ACB8E8V0_9SAUR